MFFLAKNVIINETQSLFFQHNVNNCYKQNKGDMNNELIIID